ncbi:MAG TPA: hypothetical protein VHP37_03035 [Burkholderiales bacterium]|nr:hypothetical protein [Burkholderiales bacterium]
MSVTGAANLAGTVGVEFESGSYAPKRYSILTYTDRSGTFGSLITPVLPPLLAVSLAYSDTETVLELRATTANLPGLSGNQAAVGDAIAAGLNNGAPPGSPFLGLLQKDPDALASAFKELSGELGAVATSCPRCP